MVAEAAFFPWIQQYLLMAQKCEDSDWTLKVSDRSQKVCKYAFSNQSTHQLLWEG